MEENCRMRDSYEEKIEGYWYLPGISEPECNEKDKILTDKIQLNGNTINRVKISSVDGNVDDYLAGLISELFYVQAGTKILGDYERYKDTCGFAKRLKELDAADKIHDDVIYLKRLFYKGIYSLEQVSRYEDRQLLAVFSTKLGEEISDIISFYFHSDDLFHWLKTRQHNRYYPDRLLDIDLPDFYSEGYLLWDIGSEEHRSVERRQLAWLRYIGRVVRAVYNLMYVNSYGLNREDKIKSDDLVNPRVIRSRRSDIKRLIDIWTAVFCVELGVEWSDISREKAWSDIIVIKNINAVDSALGMAQINCVMAFADSSKLHNNSVDVAKKRLRTLRLILSNCDKFFGENFFGKKAKRCYGQMLIDNDKNQYYFSLSGSMKAEAKEKYDDYYKLAEKLLNESSYIMERRNVKYVAVRSTESMRFYYGYGPGEFLEYSQVVKIKGVEEAQKNNKNFLSRSFSCCERKLLQIVDEPKKETNTNSIHIFVKYSPCEICKRALRAHTAQGDCVEVSSLRKYYKKRINTVKKLEYILTRSKALKQYFSTTYE